MNMRRGLGIALKLGILAGLGWGIAHHVIHRTDLDDLGRQFAEPLGPATWALLALALLGMPLNWSIEAWKWRLLVGRLAPISLGRALAAVLAGVTLGLFTPNRVGEYGGRVLFLPAKARWPAVPLSLVGSLAQIAVTWTAGCLALALFPARASDGWLVHPARLPLFIALAATVVLGYATLPRWARLFPRRWRETRIGRGVAAGVRLRTWELAAVLGASAARYVVFTAQYLVLLEAYGVSLAFGEGLAALGVLFLAQSSLPDLAILEPVKRGSLAWVILGTLTANELGVVAASATLWLVNLLLPAVIGYVLLLFRDPFGAAAVRPTSWPARAPTMPEHGSRDAHPLGPGRRRTREARPG